jgi:hypothetical protein
LAVLLLPLWVWRRVDILSVITGDGLV